MKLLLRCLVVVVLAAIVAETLWEMLESGQGISSVNGSGSDAVGVDIAGQDAAFSCHLVQHSDDVSGRDGRILSMPFANGLGRAIYAQRGHAPYPGCNPFTAPDTPSEIRAMDTAYHVKKMK